MYKLLNIEGDSHTITSDFNDVLVAKGMSKLPSLKRVYRILQRDRMKCNFPSILLVANWFGLSDMPVDDCDQPSNWQVTMKYIVEMYGKEYATSFERADYPQLRKAA